MGGMRIFSSEKGNISITSSSSGSVIWWDWEECNDGIMLCDETFFDLACDENDMDFDTFKDVPKNGIFKTYDEAFEYAVSKFGTLKDL